MRKKLFQTSKRCMDVLLTSFRGSVPRGNCVLSYVKTERVYQQFVVVFVVLLFYVHGKHLRSCRDGQLTQPHVSWAGLDLLSG